MRNACSPLLALALLALPALGGCNKQRYELDTKSPANAGRVEIVLTVDKTGNGDISLTFEHLAPPQHIDESLSAYVVWVESAGKDAHKLGVLRYKPKKRTGELEATYSQDKMKIIVTLEEDTNVDAPTGARVLEAEVVAPKP
ncbi:hypothetical protein G6O69_21955 [Pseudenhygromyxa sp. WMMC2535]|uniref:hypothetical protein n=1 Tax=Pseudenhygromyxa sp. WMMC2535 TaxID=2712867 RepID=UPI0015541EEF|nr:hypothetical protein [Pseudenhygromyxa sp. WMMC2535]NVB40521.1 hypothetical protein [Pseudenhygromyxa sp. WMMC2535]